MISRLRGTLLRRDMGGVELMTLGGVAYEVEIPLTVYERLPREGADIELRTYHLVREDAHTLFGFIDETERALFARLLTASGVGPRLALNMLSTMAPDRIVRAILEKDIITLRQIPGLGTKKAERLVLELADRLNDLAVTPMGERSQGRAAEEAVGALVALGYTSGEATVAVRRVLDENGGTTAIAGVELIKAALGTLGGGR